jgi:hypothetical protein
VVRRFFGTLAGGGTVERLTDCGQAVQAVVSRRLFLQHKKPEIVMNRKLISLLLVGVMGCAVQAFAEDTSNREAINSSPMTPQEKQLMKHCMAQQKAKDSSVSMDNMKKIYLDQMKIKTQKAALPMSTTKPQ